MSDFLLCRKENHSWKVDHMKIDTHVCILSKYYYMSQIRIYKVGGWVRDKFLGRPSNDLDYAVEARDFAEMKQYIEKRGCKIFLEKPEFFSIRALDPEGSRLGVDFTLCKTKGHYSDFRRPDTVGIGTIMEDLARRDFTINAMAITETDELLDPFNGKGDLERKLIRCVGNTRDRFIEDPLRILRGLRLGLVLGFDLSDELHEALTDESVVSLLEKISVERKMAELTKMTQKDTVKTINLLSSYPLVIRYTFINGLWLMPTNKNT